MKLLYFALLLLALVGNAIGHYDIRCGPLPNATLFNKMTVPLRMSAAYFFHTNYPDCPDEFNGTALEFATWPQYSNRTHTHVAGFVYGLSPCSRDIRARFAVLRDILGLFGGNISHYMMEEYHWWNVSVTYTWNPNFDIPAEFSSFSATGANLSVRVPAVSSKSVAGTKSHIDTTAPAADFSTPFALEDVQLNEPAFDNLSVTAPEAEFSIPTLAHWALPTDKPAFDNLSITAPAAEFSIADITLGDLQPDKPAADVLSTAAPVYDTLYLDRPTNEYGHFEGFLQRDSDRSDNITLLNETLTLDMDSCKHVMPLKYSSQNFSAATLPTHGITIVSNIDDFLRVSEVWNPKQWILNTFVRDFRPWRNMPQVFWQWHSKFPSIHFHYVTDAPETAFRSYVEGVQKHYPPGSFDFRPLAFDHHSQTLNARFNAIKQLIETFPERDYILLGDTSTGAALSSYVKLAHTFRKQIKCVVLRDVAETEKAQQWISPWSAPLKNIKNHVFFANPSQLAGFEDALAKIKYNPANFSDVDCTTMLPLAEKAKERFVYDGFLAAWGKTWWGAFSEWAMCWMCVEKRPNRVCDFDRRPGTAFFWGGPPEVEFERGMRGEMTPWEEVRKESLGVVEYL